jgi:hypothetical protein
MVSELCEMFSGKHSLVAAISFLCDANRELGKASEKAQPLELFGVLSGTADRVRVPCVARLHESCFDVFDC